MHSLPNSVYVALSTPVVLFSLLILSFSHSLFYEAKPCPCLHRGKAHFDIKNVTYSDQYREELITEHQALANHNSHEDFGGRGGFSEKEGKLDILEIISHRQASVGYSVEAGREQGT